MCAVSAGRYATVDGTWVGIRAQLWGIDALAFDAAINGTTFIVVAVLDDIIAAAIDAIIVCARVCVVAYHGGIYTLAIDWVARINGARITIITIFVDKNTITVYATVAGA